jgi:ribonuclease J
MYQLTRPRIAIPVHGEARHMVEHAKLAESCQVQQTVLAPNGSMVRLAPGNAEVVDRVPTGRLGIDGQAIIPLSGETIRERRQMQFNGVVVVSVALDSKGGLATEPEATILGLAESEEDFEELYDMIVGAAEDAVTDLSAKKRGDDAEVHEAVRRAARRVAKAATGKRPPTEVHVMRV